MPSSLKAGWPPGWAAIRESRWEYIVFGNGLGTGGHTKFAKHYPLPIVNGRAKTYFPWSADRVADAIKQVALHPDETPIMQGPLARLHYGTVARVRVLVIVTRPTAKSPWEVWNAYPKAR